MQKEADWMKDLVVKNLTTAAGTLTVPIAERLTGMTLSEILYTVAPAATHIVAFAGGAGYIASKYNQYNIEQQAPIRQIIDELTQKKSDIEEKLEHAGNRQERYKCRKQLREIESELLSAKGQLKALESGSITKIAAEAYDAASETVRQSVQNISTAYQVNGVFFAISEAANYVNVIPGIGGYTKAVVEIMSGNITDGLTGAAVHAFTGGGVLLPNKVADAMAKTNAKELMSGLVIPSILKVAEAQSTTAYSP